jgi:hypothetical protein
MRRWRPLLPLVAAALLAGCGGGGSAGDAPAQDAASLVPADALAYVAIDSDLSSPQIQEARSILQRFPFERGLLASIRSAAAKNGVDVDKLMRSAGPVVDLAFLRNGATATAAGVVAFAKPSDEQEFEAALAGAQGRSAHAKIGGWTVVARSQQALDAVTSRAASLADDPSYRAALRTLPGAGDAIARVYASPAAFQLAGSLASGRLPIPSVDTRGLGHGVRWLAAALTAESGTFRLEAHVKQRSAAPPAPASPLVRHIPAGAVAAFSLSRGLTVSSRTQAGLRSLSRSLGVDLAGLVEALHGPVIAYVRPGAPLPEVTVAAAPADPARALKSIHGLAARFLTGHVPMPATVDGVALEKVDLGPVAFYWGTLDGRVVVTDSTAAIGELRGGSGSLSGDPAFKQATSEAGMLDANDGFLYVNMKEVVPMIEGFAQLANRELPASVDTALKHLRSILVFADRRGDLQNVVISIATS